MRVAATIIVLAAIVAGCNAEDETRLPPVAPGDAPGISTHAREELMTRPNVQQVRCSSRLPFVKHAVGVHATLDLRAYPKGACVVELRDGRKVDYLRIRGQDWIRIGR